MHVIQCSLGQAQVSTTRIYTDPTDPLTRDAVGRIGRVLWPGAEETRLEMQPGTVGEDSLTGEFPGQRRVGRQGLEP